MPELAEKGDVRRKLLWLLTAAVGLLLIYFLGIGPAIFVATKVPPPLRTPIEYFYCPVAWLEENTLLKAPIDFYIRFWIEIAQRP